MANLVASRSTIRRDTSVARSSLNIGDVFKTKSGRLIMHTGVRTNPPSSGRDAGKIVGYQGVVIDGKHKDGSDGATVTFDLNQKVDVVGKAEFHLKQYA